jgi:anti-anti-sigma factor
VTLAPDPAFREDLELLRQQLQATDPVPDIVLDMSAVDRINSSNLAQMLDTSKLLSARDARLRVAGVQDAVWAVIITTALDKVFDFQADTSTALADLQI